ncbi:MAG: HAD hydrolase family protein [Verrucomicrobiota bacterium]|nr:HAD hydrolase family protein [Verrucomicrobiota bacterium]
MEPLDLSAGMIDSGLRQLVRSIRLVAFDFDGVFTDNLVYVATDGTEMVRCTRADGIGLRKLERLGIKPIIISTESNPVVSARSRKLAIECVQSCEDKKVALRAVLDRSGLAFAEVAFVGNDVNDICCFESVGLPIAVHDAHADIAPYVRLRTATPGGHGAVREVCDFFERMHTRES